MLEHVRRRALLCPELAEVVVATCDTEIADCVQANGGTAIMTSDAHQNGTTRVAEAISSIDCSHVMLLQGDEPLLLPRHVNALASGICAEPDIPAWNLVGELEKSEEMDRHSFVKCGVTNANRILYCFRRSPYFSDFSIHSAFARKMLGVIAYRKDFLLKLTTLKPSPMEVAESIEQMRILENGFAFKFVQVSPSLPSINEPSEVGEVQHHLRHNPEQQSVLQMILRGNDVRRLPV